MSFFAELKRRNVFKVAVAYAIVAWLLLQVSDTLVPALHLPEWFNSGVAFVLIIGFPIAMIFAWAFEMTPEGIKKEKDVDRTHSITSVTGQKLNNAIIGVLVLALGYFAIDKFVLDPGRDAARIENAVKISQQQTPEVSESAEPDNSIAVLPFINMSSDQEQEYFSDGLTEELLNLLAKIPGLQVAARTSSFTFKGQNLEIPEIAARLKVAHVLEGSVRKSGDQVRITAQLIRADSGYHMWSETYDRKLENIFAVQDEIAAAVVDALKLSLLGEAPVATEADPEAYALFLQGRYWYNFADRQSTGKAVTAYRRAIEIDPNYALAWAGLSLAIIHQAGQGWIDLTAGVNEARGAAEQAVTLNPDLALGWVSLGNIQGNYDWNWASSLESMQKALKLEPNASYVLQAAAGISFNLGRLDQAIALFRQASAADPLNQRVLDSFSGALEAAGQLQEAEQVERHLHSLNPDYFAIHATIGWILLRQGDAEQALAELENETDDFWGGLMRQLALYSLGRYTEADAALASFIENYHQFGAYQIAETYSWRNETDKAFEWLEIAYQQHDPGMGSLLRDHTLRNLHDDPRWELLLEKIGLLEAWNEMPANYKGVSQ
jgi:TolB-like protein/Tfp pilus assembly protein PilF